MSLLARTVLTWLASTTIDESKTLRSTHYGFRVNVTVVATTSFRRSKRSVRSLTKAQCSVVVTSRSSKHRRARWKFSQSVRQSGIFVEVQFMLLASMRVYLSKNFTSPIFAPAFHPSFLALAPSIRRGDFRLVDTSLLPLPEWCLAILDSVLH